MKINRFCENSLSLRQIILEQLTKKETAQIKKINIGTQRCLTLYNKLIPKEEMLEEINKNLK